MAVMFGAMLMRLAPLLEFSLWGSDWGEYFHLADRLVQDGYHPERNLGWGRAYVDFPGLFDLNGAVALVTGVGTATSMTVIIPCITAISCLLVACIVLRLGGGPRAALVSAGVLALMFPEVFTNSHPVPGPLGSVLVMGIMLVFIMGDVWRRDEGVDAERPMTLYALLLLLLFVLTVTHHLSLFFIIVVLSMAYLLRCALVHGEEPQRRFWGLWTMVAALSLATVYWVVLASTFKEEVMGDLAGIPGHVMMGVAWIGLLIAVLLGAVLRRRVGRPFDGPYWGPSLLRPALVVFLLCAAAIVVTVSFLGFPGTSIEPGSEMALYVLPTVVVFTLLVGSTDVVMRQHGGHIVVAWVAALVASFMLTTAMQSHVLIPYRHIPYIVEAAAVLIGIGAIHLWRMLGPSKTSRGSPRRRSSAAMAICILAVVALAATAYPPKAVMGGFQEGTSESELGASLWLRGGLPFPGAAPADLSSGAVATDHRLSSMSFGIGGQMATWDTAGPVLHGERDADTWAALQDVDTPNGDRPVTAVVLSDDLRTGAALSQFEGAMPLDGDAWDKFFEPPFLRVYDGGDVWVMYVVRPLGEPEEL